MKQLLSDLVRFQDKQHAKDPVKAKARKRYVVGLREIKKFLVVKKVSAIYYDRNKYGTQYVAVRIVNRYIMCRQTVPGLRNSLIM